MSKRLEDFITNNKQHFDELEPRADLWSKIETELPQHFRDEKREGKSFSLGFVLRVAALITLVMGTCFITYLAKQKPATISLAAINPEYAKQQVHYTSLIASQRTELKSIAKTDPQLYKEFTAEIAKMDSTYKKLNKDLATSPNQEAVLRAMIRNLQVQTEVLNQQLNVIEQFNEFKNQKNESKNI
jgi:septal ring factor EnvC (AmiA/AmiB activator)